MNTMNQSSQRVSAENGGLSKSVRTSSCSSEMSRSSSLPLVETTDLVKSFKEGIPPALDHFDTRVAGGAVTGLAGPDGAGKTTLMRLLAGFVLPPCGEFPPLRFLPSNPPAR